MCSPESLIKEFKTTISGLMGLEAIDDDSPGLIRFFTILERIFYDGLRGIGNQDPAPYSWMNSLAMDMEKGRAERVFGYVRAVDETRACRKVSTNLGRFRQLIRCCLVYRCVHVPVFLLIREKVGMDVAVYEPGSVIGHPVFGEIALSVFMQTSQLSFTLDLNNARFLDHSWILPETIKHTFVPCQKLGLVMTFLQDIAVVVDVEHGSLADEEKIEPGDVIDELNDCPMTLETSNILKNVLTRSRAQPVSLRVLKIHSQSPGMGYEPCLELYTRTPNLSHLNHPGQKNHIKKKHALHYLGCCSVGRRGDVSLVNFAIQKVKTEEASSAPLSVHIDCGELELVVYSGSVVLMRHPFVQISACGFSQDFPKHLAYIVGDGPCSDPNNYTCHVFEASSLDLCGTILFELKLGFERTQFTV